MLPDVCGFSSYFSRVLSKTACFHDWYLKNLYVANTGKEIVQPSKNGLTSIQIEFCTSNNDVSYLLAFVNASTFNVQMNISGDVSKQSFTSFGRCYVYNIEQNNMTQKHEFIFEGNSSIEITCEKVKCKKICNTPFI